MKILDLFRRRLFWRQCEKHDTRYDSDLCPMCVRVMAIRYETQEHVAHESNLHLKGWKP